MNTNTKIKAVIFDLDGTLLDTLKDLYNATNAALRMHLLPERTIDEVCRFVGNGIPNLIARALPGGDEAATTNDLTDNALKKMHSDVLADFKAYYDAHCEDNTKPYEGIADMLQALKNNGIHTGVVSNKADFAVKKLIPNYFPGLIDAASGENEACGIPKKPAPEMVLRILEELNISAENAIYVGDSDVDIVTAANAGMPCISVLWGFRSREFLINAGAERFALVPADITGIVLGS
ncbi:MAG: HAD family hydrolase [Eubacterium sp.]|nr:HAD family hydrolase [Eubacterium sp.]